MVMMGDHDAQSGDSAHRVDPDILPVRRHDGQRRFRHAALMSDRPFRAVHRLFGMTSGG